MNIKLLKSEIKNFSKITITGSKSESNRLLLLQALHSGLEIENISNSDDSVLMQKALAPKKDVIDIHHAGTAMRFLTAYFAIQTNREVVLTGSSRMKERPISILVEALQQLGADISYLEEVGFPSLKIKGKHILKNKVNLNANVSSQYISALLLVASKLKNGLELTLNGEITSIPYINMTLALLNRIGVETNFNENKIEVKPNFEVKKQVLVVESDWSSASYFYSAIALSKIGTEIELTSYKKDSLQGDSVLAEIYNAFGVETSFEKNTVRLKKAHKVNSVKLEFNLIKSPDIAQTIAVTAFGLGLECYLTGLHTLKIKETDRLVALKTELEKLGAVVSITDNTLYLETSKTIKKDIKIDTYYDHRMAMSFAPLALKKPIIINDAEVVSKSFPTFWNDLKSIGFLIEKNNN
ncbi:3-phosphoshikimate 1-carboxyvinyltransferase [Aurantibacter sp.]|uniref:3-phosphoshikimate 1-carboxyvinyltransferase n=1 Tax=Aurantibacter sp. TaxID=2807103 RepID=UPI0035C7CEB5